MKLLTFTKTVGFLFLIASLSINAFLSYYHFGDWQKIPEWEVKVFGYSLTSSQDTLQTSLAFSKINNLTGQYEHLAKISKDISHQFDLLKTDIEQIENTADLTRETILRTSERLSVLQTALKNKSDALKVRDKELAEKEKAIIEAQFTIAEAKKVIKNQQRQLKASPTLRMDNDAYILQHEFNRLSQGLDNQIGGAQFIQTTLRKGIVSLPIDLIFNANDSNQLSSEALEFLRDFSKSMAYLPNATVEVVQVVGVEVSSSTSLASIHSAAVGAELLNQGLSPESMVVSSQPKKLLESIDATRIELHVKI